MCRSIHVGVQFSQGIDPHSKPVWLSSPRYIGSSLCESENQASVNWTVDNRCGTLKYCSFASSITTG